MARAPIDQLTTRLIDNADRRNGTYKSAGTIQVILSDDAATRRRAFIQNANVAAYQVDDELFLAGGGNEDVLHLNALACSLWEMIEYPTSEATAVRLVAAAFPQVPRRRIKRDVRKTFDTFRESGVIVPVP
jgi:hypothetical protein